MEPFEFHPELFEFRSAVLETLAERGLNWPSDFGAVDLQHDVYRSEVTAIRRESDARAIEAVLRPMFPNWHNVRTYYEDHNVRELGWKVVIARNRDDFVDRWQTTHGAYNLPPSIVGRIGEKILGYAISCFARPRR